MLFSGCRSDKTAKSEHKSNISIMICCRGNRAPEGDRCRRNRPPLVCAIAASATSPHKKSAESEGIACDAPRRQKRLPLQKSSVPVPLKRRAPPAHFGRSLFGRDQRSENELPKVDFSKLNAVMLTHCHLEKVRFGEDGEGPDDGLSPRRCKL